MSSASETHTKNYTYYFLDDMINIKNRDPNNIKINERSYTNIHFTTVVMKHQIT